MKWTLLLPEIALIALFACPALAQPKLLFVGDSITRGLGATDPDTLGFVALLADRFPEATVVNAGCGGATVRDWTIDEPDLACPLAAAWPALAEPELPVHITHILLGTNDALGFFEFFPDTLMGRFVPPDEYAERIRVLVARATGLVILSTPPPNPLHSSDEVDERLRAYIDVLHEVATESDRVAFGADFYSLLDPDSDMDGIHPNDRGYARMADELERRILATIPRGALAPCRKPFACGKFTFLPRFLHPKLQPALH